MYTYIIIYIYIYTYIYIYICIIISIIIIILYYITLNYNGRKPSSSSNFSIRASRACPLVGVRQTILSIVRFEPTVSQSTVPSPFLSKRSVYVFMYACMYVCMYVYIYIYTQLCIYIYIYICIPTITISYTLI